MDQLSRHLLRFGVGALCGLAASIASAQVDSWTTALWPEQRSARAGLGLQPAGVQVGIGCGVSLLPCDSERDAAAARLAGSFRWNLELAPADLGPARYAVGPGAARQGLSLSLVGSKPLFGSNISVYGRLGATTYGMADTGLPARGWAGSPEAGAGLSFGAGVSMALTPRLSATLGWDSYDLRLGPSAREPLRSTSLGLQYRY